MQAYLSWVLHLLQLPYLPVLPYTGLALFHRMAKAWFTTLSFVAVVRYNPPIVYLLFNANASYPHANGTYLSTIIWAAPLVWWVTIRT